MDEPTTYTKVNKATARRYGKRVLAVRAMAGETAWLDGRIVWLDGRVAWETEGKTVAPTAAILALAQRRLAQIEGYPRSSGKAFGDASAWLATRRARLELAKKLQGVEEPDVWGLVQRAQKDDRDIARLVTLLPVEAYCLNPLPASPGAALVACGGRAVGALVSMAADAEALPGGRALAAMIAGAIGRQRVEAGERGITQPRWSARAYAWGLKHGWLDDAPLLLDLLAKPDGIALAERFERAAREGSRFVPAGEDLRKAHARGIDASRIVEVCEACAAMEPLAVRIMHYRDKLADVPLQWRQATAAELQDERRALVADLIEVVQKYALTNLDPPVIYSVGQLTGMLLDLGNHPEQLAGAALTVLKEGLELPAALRGPFLDLLLEQFEGAWDRNEFSQYDAKGTEALQEWLTGRYNAVVSPISRLLARSGDAGIVREALARDVVIFLSYRSWKDPELYRFVLRLVRDLGIKDDLSAPSYILGHFASARAARTVLRPLVSSIMQARNVETRERLAYNIFDALSQERAPYKQQVQGLVRDVPRLIRFVESPGVEHGFCWVAVKSALLLNGTAGEQAAVWLDALLAPLEEWARRSQLGNDLLYTLEKTLPFLVALAAGDLERFDLLVRAALAHSFDLDREQIKKSVEVLTTFPALRDALARVFPLQPHRCLVLAVKMGFISRLGKDASAPLGYLEGSGNDVDLPQEWHDLVTVVPRAEIDARHYVRARHIIGEADDLPPGVRKALEQPRKLAAELAFLEQKLASEPDRAGMSARVENLRARLSDEGKMIREVRAEVEEKMAQIAAEAQIATAEVKMLECYRVKLEGLAGKLPRGAQIHNDLVNATLLMCDVDANRKLLLKMLRAYVKGDRRWHEQHPGNVKYIAGLKERSVDVDAWLGANPRRYACTGVAGGKVRLLLERDPLKVLQMGNYFDTCLSFGKFNSFSTVANAAELNKRVIYAYDGTGRVVGRKLIGIDDKGKLVGFRTYSTLGEEEGKALRNVFRRYCADFAARCNLELADQGTVPKLFAADWYDDGTVPWSEKEEEVGKTKDEGRRT